jgi:hypothetical protein
MSKQAQAGRAITSVTAPTLLDEWLNVAFGSNAPEPVKPGGAVCPLLIR